MLLPTPRHAMLPCWLLCCCTHAGNRDIAACIPSFLTSIMRPKEVPDAILKLSGTTFVQAVEVGGG